MKLILFCAMTVDGKIARSTNELINWTSSEDKKIFSSETKKAGVVIMGNNTFKTFGKPLKERLNLVMTSSPASYEGENGVLEYTSAVPDEIVRMLERRGFKSAFVIGGAKVNGLFWDFGLISEVWITIVPRIFGQGVELLSSKVEQNLNLLSIDRLLDGYLLLKYSVDR